MNGVISIVAWQSTGLTMLGLVLVLAVGFDSWKRRIPNKLVLTSLAFGLILNSVETASNVRAGIFSAQPSALGLWLSLAGALTGLLLFLPFYLLRVLGAGDVKLMAAVGTFAGPAATVNLALFVLLAGGVLALVRLLLFPGKELVRANLVAMLGQFRPGATGPGFDAATQTAWRMPYAVAIALGVVAYGAWTLSGLSPILNF